MPEPELLRPRSLAEASAMLVEHEDDALAIAGGTALVLLLRQRLLNARYLVDLAGLPGLGEIGWTEGTGARIGALVTLREVERSPALRSALPLLTETYASVGNVRVRHAATVGGNLAHGDHRLDPPAALLALGARVTITGPGGPRELPLSEFFRGPGETALGRGEIITGLAIPAPPAGTAGAYVKVTALAADDWPCVGAAALLALDAAGRVTTLSVGLTAASTAPLLLAEAGPLAVGRVAGADMVEEIAVRAAARVEPIADLRGSEWYKREVTAAAVRDALDRALARARAGRAQGCAA